MVFYKSFLDAINLFEDDKTKLECFYALINFGLYGNLPNTTNPSVLAIFNIAKPSIKMCENRYNSCVENGKKGGAPVGNQNARKKVKLINLPKQEISLNTDEINLTTKPFKNNLKTTQHNPSFPLNSSDSEFYKNNQKTTQNNLTNTNTNTNTNTETETNTINNGSCFSSHSNSLENTSQNSSLSKINEINLENNSTSLNNHNNSQNHSNNALQYSSNNNSLQRNLSNKSSQTNDTLSQDNFNNFNIDEYANNYIPIGVEREKFLHIKQTFINYFPNKNNKLKKFAELNELNYNSINIEQLIAKIDLSDFLRLNNNLGLEWCLLNKDKILQGDYDNFTNQINLNNASQPNKSIQNNNNFYNNNLGQKQMNDLSTLERYRKANNFYSDSDLNKLYVTDYEQLMRELDEENARNLKQENV